MIAVEQGNASDSARIIRPCEICGTLVTRYRSQMQSHCYCSNQCRGKSKERKITVACEQCDREFTKKTSQIESSVHHFCSPACWYTWNTTPPEERFWAKVDKSGECWIWQGATSTEGYGRFGITRDHVVPAHRFAWETVNGPLPENKHACHSCDVRLCVRPSHIFAGTQADNIADMISKGRAPQGERHGGHKLTTAKVEQVWDLRQQHLSLSQIAQTIGRPKSTIQAIFDGRTWKSIGTRRRTECAL